MRRARRLQDQKDVLERIQLCRHGLPDVICGHQEFNKAPFLQFCFDMNINFISVTANQHEGNVMVERANRTIREHLACLSLAEPRTSLIDQATMATFYENTSRGHKKASSFELLYDRAPKLTTVCNLRQHGTVEDNLSETRRRQIQAWLSAKNRTNPDIDVRMMVFF